jgi:toxin ParE1/3/4
MRVELSRRSEEDLEPIGDFIARDNPRRAVTFAPELRAQRNSLGLQPEMGSARPEYGDGISIWPDGRCAVLYSVPDDHVLVERVVHGARDLDALLGEG